MKISITSIVLEKLAEIGVGTLDAFFPKKYSYTHGSRRLLGLDSYPKVSPPTLSAILSRLKKQGLVERVGNNRNSSWSITKKGLQKIRHEYLDDALKKDDIARLVIFDIPERERKKRDIVRAELVGCGFEKLQKSVWIGYNPLPKSFIDSLDNLNLRGKVHIFSIRDRGTL